MEYSIPFARPNVGAMEAWAARKAIAAGQLTSGPESAEAVAKLASLWGIRPGRIVLTSSGTAALWLAYRTANLGVARVPALTFPATLNAAPLGVEVYDCGLETKQSGVAVGLWGSKPNADYFIGVSVADYCQCIGSLPPEPHATTCYSFNTSKPIVAAGGGCAVFTSVEEADHAQARFSPRQVGGFNWAMTNVQAAVLDVQLSRYAEIMGAREGVLREYAKYFNLVDGCNVAVLSVPENAAKLEARLLDVGIEAKRPWTLGGPELYPMANRVRDGLLALPTHGSRKQIQEVAKAVRKAAKLEGVKL